jgi:hypothetical protein
MFKTSIIYRGASNSCERSIYSFTSTWKMNSLFPHHQESKLSTRFDKGPDPGTGQFLPPRFRLNVAAAAAPAISARILVQESNRVLTNNPKLLVNCDTPTLHHHRHRYFHRHFRTLILSLLIRKVDLCNRPCKFWEYRRGSTESKNCTEWHGLFTSSMHPLYHRHPQRHHICHFGYPYPRYY